MILYHYSVDSFQGGDALINDYKAMFCFAEPFMLALEKGEECFWSTLFSTMSYSRELCALGLRKHENYLKDAIEGVFEYVRRTEFKNQSVSRIGCVYYCESCEEAISYLRDDCIHNGDFTLEQVKLLEVDVEDSRIFRYDQNFFNIAQAVMERERDLERVILLARDYFSMKRSDKPLIEILSDGKNKVLRELSIA
ncbi:MAG: hypothetical protein IJ833_08335 [Lachnospiraceae bacterium]|nr:hypothetical protein [Lachnospiraceae bacterium]